MVSRDGWLLPPWWQPATCGRPNPRRMPVIDPGRRRPPSGGNRWTPAVWGSSVVWFTAADASTITTVTGGAATDWRDKGSGRHLAATSTQRPTYVANGLNGRPTMDWGAAINNKRMTWTGPLFSPVRTFGVAQWDGPNPFTGYSGLLSFPFAGNSDLFLVEVSNQWFGARQVSLNGNDPITTPLPTISSPFMWADKVTINPNKNTMWIGADRAEANRGWRGKISEVIITLFLPTVQDVLNIEGYLAHEWGLQAGLPSSHLYRNSPPML